MWVNKYIAESQDRQQTKNIWRVTNSHTNTTKDLKMNARTQQIQ